MSKAFVNEDVIERDAAEALPPRPAAPLPITPRGVVRLRDELAALDPASRRARVIAQVLATVAVRAPALQSGGAGFGCAVDVDDERGARRRDEIVGPDESEPQHGRISVASPLGRALLGAKAGDVVVVRKPNGDEELTVVAVIVPPA